MAEDEEKMKVVNNAIFGEGKMHNNDYKQIYSERKLKKNNK